MGFLNIDLDVRSRADLSPLVAALAGQGVPLLTPISTDADGAHLAIFELDRDSLASTAAALLDALEAIPPDLLALATSRSLHLGYDAESGRVLDSLPAALVARCAALQLGIALTIYPAA